MATTATKEWDGGRFECCRTNSSLHGCESFCQNQFVAMGATQERTSTGCQSMTFMVAYCLVVYLLISIVGATAEDWIWIIYLLHAVLITVIGFRARMDMVRKYGLREEGCCTEAICWFCCSPCTVCQEYRTIKLKVDPQGNWIDEDVEAAAAIVAVPAASTSPPTYDAQGVMKG